METNIANELWKIRTKKYDAFGMVRKFKGVYRDIVAFGNNLILNGIVDVGPVSILKRTLNATPIKNGLNNYIGKYIGVHSTITSIGMVLL